MAEGLEFNLEPRAVLLIEIALLDEGMQSLASGRKWPVIDHIKFRLGGAVAITGQIVADMLDAFLEEITFAELEREAVLLADL